MHYNAIAAAEERLERMRFALSEMQKLPYAGYTFLGGWTAFLTSSAMIYRKLEQGAKDNQLSRDWFAGVKSVRSSDELLNFLHRSRAAITEGKNSLCTLSYVIIDGVEAPRPLIECDGPMEPTTMDSLGGERTEYVYRPALKPLVFQGSATALPTTHLGTQISGRWPISLAELALTYFERLVTEARTLPQGDAGKDRGNEEH